METPMRGERTFHFAKINVRCETSGKSRRHCEPAKNLLNVSHLLWENP
jgi:hypothetical protein